MTEARWQDRIRIGTSGYSYPAWVGKFYTPGTGRREMLEHYASCFDTVELNFTYYGIPRPAVLERMVKETPDGFTFFVKAHKSMTHGDGTPRCSAAVATYLEAVSPLRESGKLGGVLLQFPQSFHDEIENRRHLDRLVANLDGIPLIVEMRHDCWLKAPFYEYLRRKGLAFCCVDEPDLPGLLPRISIRTADTSYVRFHSRDGDRWYSADRRYDYNYSEEELLEWVPKLRDLALSSSTVYVFFNNCHGAQAAANANELRTLLGQRTSMPRRMEQKPLFSCS